MLSGVFLILGRGVTGKLAMVFSINWSGGFDPTALGAWFKHLSEAGIYVGVLSSHFPFLCKDGAVEEGLMQASRISNAMLNRCHAAHAIQASDFSVSFTCCGEAGVVRVKYQKEGGKERMHGEERAVVEVKGEEWETNGTGGARMNQHLEDSWEEALEQRDR